MTRTLNLALLAGGLFWLLAANCHAADGDRAALHVATVGSSHQQVGPAIPVDISSTEEAVLDPVACVRPVDGSRVVLVALTGWGQEQDQRRAYAAGFDHHVTKPVEPEALESLIASAAHSG